MIRVCTFKSPNPYLFTINFKKHHHSLVHVIKLLVKTFFSGSENFLWHWKEWACRQVGHGQVGGGRKGGREEGRGSCQSHVANFGFVAKLAPLFPALQNWQQSDLSRAGFSTGFR